MGIFFSATNYGLKDHEKWWEYNLEKTQILIEFEQWLGSVEAPSRKLIRKIVKENDYKKVCDIPCGLGIDYLGFIKDKINVEYQGIDTSSFLVDLICKKNIPATVGSIENMSYSSNYFDCVFCRHILEHLDYYEIALKEVVRVARFEAIIVFFISPDNEPDRIDRAEERGYPLYHNKYNKAKLEQFVLALPDVKNIEWIKIDETSEAVLRIKK